MEIKCLVVILKEIFLILWIIRAFPTILIVMCNESISWKLLSAEQINKQAVFGG